METETGNNNSAEFKNLETSDENHVVVTGEDSRDIRALKRKISVLEREKESFEEETVSLKAQKRQLVEDLDARKKEKDLLIEEYEAFHNKHIAVTSKLRDQIECPVCLEVPTSGPVYCCTNGHFVCSKCKGPNCPTCRSKMFNGKSLLAVTVIENIDHKCRNDECGKKLPLAEYEVHVNVCPHRIISCPSPNQFCTKKIALSKVYEHILTECEGSLNKTQNEQLNDGKFPRVIVISDPIDIPLVKRNMRGLCLDFEDVKFYLNMEKAAGYAVFSVMLLENADKCKDYEVTLAVYRTDDKELKGKYVQRQVWDALSVDFGEEERKVNGLMVGHKMLEKIAVKEGDKWKFNVRVDVKKM